MDPIIVYIQILICIIFLAIMSGSVNNVRAFINNMDAGKYFFFLSLCAGFSIITLNLFYTNNYIATIGSVIIIGCGIFLKIQSRNIIEIECHDPPSKNYKKYVSISFWSVFSIGILMNYLSPPYSRSIFFFICIALLVSIIALYIYNTDAKSNSNKRSIVYSLFLIFSVSLLFRASGFFISPIPIGIDTLAHIEYINNFIGFEHLIVSQYPYASIVNNYYINYPLMHIFSISNIIILGVSTNFALFVISIALLFSTLFVYLIAKFCFDENIALMSVLLLNFSDFYIQFGNEIIAMSFGIALFAMVIFLGIKIGKTNEFVSEDGRNKYVLLFLIGIISIVWTHTIASFIASIVILSIYVLYPLVHTVFKTQKNINGVKFTAILLPIGFIILLITHWLDKRYPFFQTITSGLMDALGSEAAVLSLPTSVVTSLSLNGILHILGFLLVILLGVIGVFTVFNERNKGSLAISLGLTSIVLFGIMFGFPVVGLMKNDPYRWPVFIYMIFIIFSVIGLFAISKTFNKKRTSKIFLFLVTFCIAFFMISNMFANMDSPVYGKDITRISFWKESDIALFERLNDNESNMITTDYYSYIRPFITTLKRDKNVQYFKLDESGIIDHYQVDNSAIIWRNIALTRPIGVDDNYGGHKNILLNFKNIGILSITKDKTFDYGEIEVYT